MLLCQMGAAMTAGENDAKADIEVLNAPVMMPVRQHANAILPPQGK